MHTENTSPWLTMGQYADQTQTSVSSVKRLKQAGLLPYTQFGRSVRIPSAALNFEWLQKWRNENAA